MKPVKKLLIANRGEISLRVQRTAAEMRIRTVAVFSKDDARSLHVRSADEARELAGVGAAAYLDVEAIVATAKAAGCDALHPGYGFLSENPALARRCEEVGIRFVGPTVETLEIFGDKTTARLLAERCGVRVLRGTAGPATVSEARSFLASLRGGAIVLKAIAGGGGRGMRVVATVDELEAAYQRCRSEALAAFGNGEVFAEERLSRARHVEVQIVGDGTGGVAHLGERDCSIQRRHQKLVEIAPSPGLPDALRRRIAADALSIAREVRYRGAGTFEFLVDRAATNGDARYAFIEANPRLQVEHPVTEAVTGLDIVRLQLEIAAGRTLAEIGIDRDASARGHAIELRINTETIGPDGVARPSGGRVAALAWPSGPGVRVDTAARVGYETNPNFDSLLAKIVVHSSSERFDDCIAKARRALAETEIEGVRTNVGVLSRLLDHPDFAAARFDTEFFEARLGELASGDDGARSVESARALAGAKVDATDPLAVLDFGKSQGVSPAAPAAAPTTVASVAIDELEGLEVLRSAMQGTIVSLEIEEGDVVRRGQPLLVMNAMKMEHVIAAPESGVVHRVTVATGDTVPEGHPLVAIEAREVAAGELDDGGKSDPTRIRPDLAEVIARHEKTLDRARADAIERRRATGQRTARENLDDLCDPGTLVEYGALGIAAQRQRRTVDDLIDRTPADGLVAGIASVNGGVFDESRSRCVVMSYDYTVLAGTQGFLNHRKKDRMFELAERMRLPVVIFTEGGGGRPGDTDAPGVASLDCMAFHLFGKLSGLVPLVAVNSGRCFAGNAALLGCCDVVIATERSNIGMGGPAMIEGGGLGVFRPEDVGPMSVQVPNGVVDVAVADDVEAVRVAKQYLSYFQGPVAEWACADQQLLRAIVPENRLRVYEVRDVIHTLADTGSVLELRRHFGLGMVTALARIEGRPLGIIANDPKHLSGAIDSPGADKASRFMQLCDAFDLPIVFLCDTPGIMVGPEIEKTALVRHCSRMFVVGSSLTVPFFTIVLRKSYGLGAQAMGGGSHKAPLWTVSWPTGEFGGMGLEGAVKLGFRKELAAIADPAERKRSFEERVARAYQHGKALNSAAHFEIDDVIDPAESRRWLVELLRAVPPPPPRREKKRPCIDTW